MANGKTASSPRPHSTTRMQRCRAGGPRSLPARGRLVPDGCGVMVVDDAGTGRSQSAGGAVPDPRAWDHIPPCGSDDLAVSVRWERAGVGLAGQIIAENVSGRTCRLSHKPWVIPLGTDGRELPVEAIITAELRLDPVILGPGGRAAAPVGWAGWCGDAASGVVRVKGSCGSIGSAPRPSSRLRDPANRTAPTPGSRRTFRRLGLTPWTDHACRRAPATRLGDRCRIPADRPRFRVALS
jgi:hypothetical protein